MSNEIITQVSVEREMGRLILALEHECLDELEAAGEAAAKAEVTFKVKYAQAYLKAAGTGPVRQSIATIETEQELFQRLVTERRVVLAREKIGAYKASLDSLRTLLVGVREQTR